jgi:hypothetical protein
MEVAMHTRRLVSALGIGLALVFALDYASVAATGQSLVLGQLNKAGDTTVVTRTTQGPTLKLNSKPGSPPLAVNRSVRINKLNADRVDGVQGFQLAKRSTVSAYEPPGCPSVTSFSTGFQKIADIATINKVDDDSLLRIELITRLYVDSMTGNGAIFELRIDDAPTTVGTARALYRSIYAGEHLSIPFMGIFAGIPAGDHEVSVWVRTNSGTGAQGMIDPGCWNGQDVNQLFVTEFH